MAVRACLRLCRPANVWTAFGDVAAGSAVALGAWPAAGRLAPVLAASGLLYAAGTAFNDVFDLERDRGLHPDRPLPSGAITRRRAVALAAGLMLAGVVLAHLAGLWPGMVAVLLSGSILIYDGFLSHTVASPLSMGACRAMNVLLGASLAGPVRWPALAAAGLVGLYTAGISLAARQEQAPRRRVAVALTWLPCLLAGVGVVLLARLRQVEAVRALPFVLAAAAWTGYRLVGAVRGRTTAAVVGLVRAMILALPILDGGIVAAYLGWYSGLAVAAVAVPAWLMGRRFHMT